jgi:hypothetical protein
MVVPSMLGVRLNRSRAEMLSTLWASHSMSDQQLAVLVRQDLYTRQCCVCDDVLSVNEHFSYQVALRIVGALSTSETWSYDVLLAFLCRRCSTVSRHAMVELAEVDFAIVLAAICDMGFKPRAAMDDFLSSSFSDGLLKSYVWRLELINEKQKSVVKALTYYANKDGDVRCYHCGHVGRAPVLRTCEHCDCVAFCTTPARHSEPRYQGGARRLADNPLLTCWDLGAIYHWALCDEIRGGTLLHTEVALYVDRSENPYRLRPVLVADK